MANLTGQEIRNTYQGLLKTNDTTALSGTAKYISDGLGNNSVLSLSTAALGIGTDSPAYMLDVNSGNIQVGDLLIGRANSLPDGGGDASLAIGKSTLNAYTGDTGNMTAVGDYALASTTNAGTSNDAFGYKALFENTTGTYNSAFGQSAGRKNNGEQNVFFGQYSGPYYATLDGGFNTFIGPLSGINSQGVAAKNTGIGASSLYNLTTGLENTAISSSALFTMTTGSGNIGIGFNTGNGITTGSYNVIIGNNVNGLDAALSNNIIIADGAGNRRINVSAAGNVGIGTVAPSQKLHVDGNLRVTGAVYDSNNETGTSGQFLSSTVTGTDWIDVSIPVGVFEAGSGTDSIQAVGGGATASGDYSFAVGKNVIASNLASTAMGAYTTASGYYSTASGYYSTAVGDKSTAMGASTTAFGDASTAMGRIQPPLVIIPLQWGAAQPPLVLVALQWGVLQPPLITFPLQWGAAQPPLVMLPLQRGEVQPPLVIIRFLRVMVVRQPHIVQLRLMELHRDFTRLQQIKTQPPQVVTLLLKVNMHPPQVNIQLR